MPYPGSHSYLASLVCFIALPGYKVVEVYGLDSLRLKRDPLELIRVSELIDNAYETTPTEQAIIHALSCSLQYYTSG
jgi:hypothetical protein